MNQSTHDYAQQFAEALVSEIKAERGRRGLSSRALGRLIGESSQYISMRLDGGNPKTGERVTLNVRDLAAFAVAFEMTEDELVRRAQEFLARSAAPVADLNARREVKNAGGSPDTVLTPEMVQQAAAHETIADDGAAKDH